MALHLIKLAVGISAIDELAARQAEWAGRLSPDGTSADHVFGYTRHAPKRAEDLLAGGSIYWVIRRAICCRQRLLGFEQRTGEDGRPFCLMHLDPELVATDPWPKKPFQGWRYLKDAQAPPDQSAGSADADLSPEMARDLRDLGLI